MDHLKKTAYSTIEQAMASTSRSAKESGQQKLPFGNPPTPAAPSRAWPTRPMELDPVEALGLGGKKGLGPIGQDLSTPAGGQQRLPFMDSGQKPTGVKPLTSGQKLTNLIARSKGYVSKHKLPIAIGMTGGAIGTNKLLSMYGDSMNKAASARDMMLVSFTAKLCDGQAKQAMKSSDIIKFFGSTAEKVKSSVQEGAKKVSDVVTTPAHRALDAIEDVLIPTKTVSEAAKRKLSRIGREIKNKMEGAGHTKRGSPRALAKVSIAPPGHGSFYGVVTQDEVGDIGIRHGIRNVKTPTHRGMKQGLEGQEKSTVESMLQSVKEPGIVGALMGGAIAGPRGAIKGGLVGGGYGAYRGHREHSEAYSRGREMLDISRELYGNRSIAPVTEKQASVKDKIKAMASGQAISLLGQAPLLVRTKLTGRVGGFGGGKSLQEVTELMGGESRARKTLSRVMEADRRSGVVSLGSDSDVVRQIGANMGAAAAGRSMTKKNLDTAAKAITRFNTIAKKVTGRELPQPVLDFSKKEYAKNVMKSMGVASNKASIIAPRGVGIAIHAHEAGHAKHIARGGRLAEVSKPYGIAGDLSSGILARMGSRAAPIVSAVGHAPLLTEEARASVEAMRGLNRAMKGSGINPELRRKAMIDAGKDLATGYSTYAGRALGDIVTKHKLSKINRSKKINQ
jgi:hypothetical protein